MAHSPESPYVTDEADQEMQIGIEKQSYEDPGLQEFVDQNLVYLESFGDELTEEERQAEAERLKKIYQNQKWRIHRSAEIARELESATPQQRASLYAEEHALNCPVTSRSVYSYAREFIPYDFSGDAQPKITEIVNDLFPKDSGLCLNIGDAYRKIDQDNVISFDCRVDNADKEKKAGRFVQGLFPDLPFKNDSFDRVVSIWTASLIMSRYEEAEFKVALDELIRVTSPGGKIFLSPCLWVDMKYLQSLATLGSIEFEIIDQEDPNSIGGETYFALIISVKDKVNTRSESSPYMEEE